ncbi:nucleic acid binding, OB-fold, tRNA/helicase-type [Methanocorpusculum labreanum Z]|uniref:Nucleic acid binding, OB-fold, tRNA/helicase-type n=1 Tax=Methanocorpusculum labreanum (strain ATCC 43576 / DSM 4855 / Z) TaxID=410358 RepID=A2SR52_METLZ|nr:hypothetical protein [Methanocorpusculum labreanum]ABN06808.1 nucleic acid binding, OB-fold, tRNA/helicase-type [Methanocorpusculum labreanum Z]
MHYALVSDLLSKEAFDERVEQKSASLGGLVDEVTAAMMVVDELGRSHIKIGEIPTAKTSIVSFFGKILEIKPPREFTREGEPPGLVASIILGDPTGTVTLSLWDERAEAAAELEVGSVIEVIAKPRPGKKEGNCLALRESNVTIVETKKPPKSEVMAAPLTVKILAAFEMKEIVRRDGTSSFLQEFIIGDASGTARLVSWSPELFADVDVGSCVSISGVQRKEDEGIIEYVVSDSAEIRIIPDEIPVLSKDASEVSEGSNPIITGVVTSVSEIRSFTTRRGTESRVRNVTIRGSSTNCSVNAAVWGDAADTLFLPGDSVQIINAAAKLNRYGELELSVGRGSVIQMVSLPGENISVTGIVILRPEGLSLDDGSEVWILLGDHMPEPGMIAEVDGVSQNGRIKVTNLNVRTTYPAPLVSRLDPLL